MTKNLKFKILFVEDLQSDFEMAQRLLVKEGIDFEHYLVDTEPAFKNALNDFEPDLIISDYSMPEFDGMSALNITRSHHTYIPFIVLTGSMNEETAVKCMKAGANDYVIKEQIKRLPFAVIEAMEHKKAIKEKEIFENKLVESERKFRDIFYNHLAVKLIIDPRTLEIVEANKAAADFYGWSTKQLEKMKISDINILDDKLLKNKASLALKSRKKHFEFRHRLADGSIKHVDVFSSTVIINGKEYLHSIIHDVTDRERAEQIRKFLFDISQLSISNMGLHEYLGVIHKRLKQIMIADNFYIALYHAKTDTYTFPYHADEYEDFTTDEPVSLKGTLTDYIRKTGRAQLITAEKENEIKKTENIRLVGEPSPVWIGAPLIDSTTNQVTGVIALQDYKNKNAYSDQDLNTLQIIAGNIGIFIEKLRNLEQLQLSESRFKSFLNSTSDLAQLEDEDYRMLFMNNAQLKLIGLKNEEDAIGKTVFELLPPDIAANCHESDKQARETDKIVKTEERWGDKTFETLKFPVNLGKGKTGVGAFIRDITEKKKMLQDLVDAKNKAEESDRLKSAFLANMSHEIRTPMNGIIGFLSLLENTDMSKDERANYMNVVNRSSDRLLNTINDIIELSKIESGQTDINTGPVNIMELINYFHEFFKPDAEKQNLEFKIKPKLTKAHSVIKTDKNKLESIIGNFLKNAFKFTKVGFVELGCFVKGSKIEFYVLDSGPGVPKSREEAIFDRFVQADLNITRAHEGSGLGLSISREYAKMLNGEIGVEAPAAGGSRFFLSIPLVMADQKKSVQSNEPASTSPKQETKTILIVEDDPDSFAYLHAVLSGKKYYRIIHAENGQEAVDICRENKTIDLILMDLKMPVLDGYEATRQIRKFNPDIPVVAQTAYALTGDSQKALEAGCNDYLSKPIKKNDLLNCIARNLY